MKIKLILLAAVMLSYHYAHGYTFTVTNKLKWSVDVKVGVSAGFALCHDKEKKLEPGETKSFHFTGKCSGYCFNKLKMKSSGAKYFEVKKPLPDLEDGYEGLEWWSCGDKSVNIIKETGKGYFIIQVTKGKL